MRIPFLPRRRSARPADTTHVQIETAEIVDELLSEVAKLNKQVAELGRVSRRRERVVIAAEELANALDDKWTASGISAHFTSMELDPLLSLLGATGHYEAADFWARYNDPQEEGLTEEDQAENIVTV